MTRACAVILGVALTSTACLIGPNPLFIDDGGTAGETDGAACPAGMLDCDNEPGCETEADDPQSCGSCDNACEFAGQALECVAGQCEGSVVLEVSDDAYVDAGQPDLNFGEQPVVIVDEQHESYLGLPDLPLPTSATIHSISLHLSCTVAGGPVDVYESGGPWDELSITHSNAPGVKGSALVSFTPTLDDNVIELAGMISEWEMGSPKRSLVLRAAGPPGQEPSEFSTSEGAAPAYLIVNLSW